MSLDFRLKALAAAVESVWGGPDGGINSGKGAVSCLWK